ncbi:MAG: metal-dependent transcriptional regulator [Cuniculiplasma sp.]
MTKKERDCLISIGQHDSEKFPLRLIDLSESLNIRSPTALNLVKRLENKKLLTHMKGMILLTGKGKSFYHEIEENHRILETLMVEYGMDLGKACLLSENIDYLVDHRSIDNMFVKLGKPIKCPHGRIIEQFHD